MEGYSTTLIGDFAFGKTEPGTDPATLVDYRQKFILRMKKCFLQRLDFLLGETKGQPKAKCASSKSQDVWHAKD